MTSESGARRHSSQRLVPELRSLADSLARASPLLAAAARAATPDTGGDCSSVKFFQAIGTLQGVRRNVEEALAQAEAADEDALVQVLLAQHQEALDAHERADAAHSAELIQLQQLRLDVAALSHRAVGGRGGMASAGHSPERRVPERERSLELRRAALEGALRDLSSEREALEASLGQALGEHRAASTEISRLEEEHHVATAENQLARRALSGESGLEAFVRSRTVEEAAGEAIFAQRCGDCEAALAELSALWVARQAEFRASLESLAAEASELSARYASRVSESRDSLAQQAAECAGALEALSVQKEQEVRRFSERKGQKAAALREEIERVRRAAATSVDMARKSIGDLVAEARASYNVAVQLEEAKAESDMQMERYLTEEAKRDRKSLELRAERTKHSYRAHAIVNGNYMKGIGKRERKSLIDDWAHR